MAGQQDALCGQLFLAQRMYQSMHAAVQARDALLVATAMGKAPGVAAVVGVPGGALVGLHRSAGPPAPGHAKALPKAKAKAKAKAKPWLLHKAKIMGVGAGRGGKGFAKAGPQLAGKGAGKAAGIAVGKARQPSILAPLAALPAVPPARTLPSLGPGLSSAVHPIPPSGVNQLALGRHHTI